MIRMALALVTSLAVLLGTTAASVARSDVCVTRKPDASLPVDGIDVLDSNAVRRLVGKDYKTVQTEPQTDFPWAVYVSRDAKQSLALMTHPGGTRFDFQEIEVKELALGKPDVLGRNVAYYIGREPRDQTLRVSEFVTARGIKLGVTKAFVTSRVGPCARAFKTRGAMETIRYEIADEKHPLLKKTGMPSYYAEYQFRAGKLVRFRFGFDYP
jgi:hypothetical protein